MIKNYLKIAWRNILRHKGYSGINIVGLAIGIAACVLILQYVTFELSYENFHTNKDRIYRVQQDRYDNGKISTQWAAGAYAVGNSFKDAVPEVEDYVKLLQRDQAIVEINNQFFTDRCPSPYINFCIPLKHHTVSNNLRKPDLSEGVCCN